VEERPARKTICVCHDVEKGAGHAGVDPAFARRADATSEAHLDRMLAIERDAGVRATYDVVGMLLADVRDRIEAGGHCLAFHSFDHHLETDGNGPRAGGGDQLARCRAVDYRIKGYRVPQSRMTPELTDENLCFHNFEWLASSAHGWGFDEPRLEKRIVKIPIHFDDFPMHHDGMPWEEWERRALAAIEERDFTAFGLHDCYGDHWLPHYASFLQKLRARGTLRTMTEVADDVFLREAGPVVP
jgi:peptidoglycan/xylan/chitin deacetylase (PgdA/CDA1 family)